MVIIHNKLRTRHTFPLSFNIVPQQRAGAGRGVGPLEAQRRRVGRQLELLGLARRAGLRARAHAARARRPRAHRRRRADREHVFRLLFQTADG